MDARNSRLRPLALRGPPNLGQIHRLGRLFAGKIGILGRIPKSFVHSDPVETCPATDPTESGSTLSIQFGQRFTRRLMRHLLADVVIVASRAAAASPVLLVAGRALGLG